MKSQICEKECVHPDKISKVMEKLLQDEELFILAEFFKVFGDSTRIKILQALAVEDMCVCDLTVLINSTQSAVSHQLRILRNTKLVKYKKVGRTVYYSLNDEHIRLILKTGIEHIREKVK